MIFQYEIVVKFRCKIKFVKNIKISELVIEYNSSISNYFHLKMWMG